VANISKEACNEKIFFNIAEAVGNDKYIIPETSIMRLKPSEYNDIGRSIDTLRKERITTDVRSNRVSYDSTTVIERLKDAEIYHFTSKIIPSYKDLSIYYDYHRDKENLVNVHNIQEGIPEEPRGMGAFFALNCFTGNRDCIGLTGKNAGIDPSTFQVIIVDGGLSQDKAGIAKSMPSSANNNTWFSYDLDLTDSSRLEALETFVRLVELNEEQIRGILTNYGEFIEKRIFTPEEIDIKLQNFMEQQKQVVGIFYEDFKGKDLVTEKISQIKQYLDVAKAQEEARRAVVEPFFVGVDVQRTPGPKKNLFIEISPPSSGESQKNDGTAGSGKKRANSEDLSDVVEGLSAVLQEERITSQFSDGKNLLGNEHNRVDTPKKQRTSSSR
jgi:hypothetical protein